VREGIDDAADGEIVVRNAGGRPRVIFPEARGVVVGQAQLNELRHHVFAVLTGGNEGVEFIQNSSARSWSG